MPEMKDSGADWIGNVPKEWHVDKLKYHLNRNEQKNPGNMQVLSLYREYGIVPKDSREDNHNVTSEDTSKYKYVKKGNFVINKMKAWQGSVAVSDFEGIVSPAYYVYEFADEKIDKRFFHYLLRGCYKDEFRRLSGGIREGQWDLPSEALSNVLIVFPDIKKQGEIAAFLDTECSEIDALAIDIQAEIDTLEEYKHSIITEKVTKGLCPNVEMRDSGIEWVGKCPANWKIMANKYIMKKVKYIKSVYDNEDILSLTVKGVIVRDLDAGGKMPTSFNGYQILYPDNLLMCLFDYDVTPRCIGLIKDYGLSSPAYSQFVMKNQNYEGYYYYYYLMLDNTKELLHLAKNLRHSFTEEQLGGIHTLVPPIAEQHKIAAYLDNKCAEIDSMIETKKEQLTTLDEYKKAIIYEYVTGKKEVI